MTSENPIFKKIESYLQGSKVVLFMKGNKTFPMCGFSSYVAQALTSLGIEYKDINVLEDQEIREGIKEYASWPTIPQLYINGEFIGGADIVREMIESGELQEALAA